MPRHQHAELSTEQRISNYLSRYKSDESTFIGEFSGSSARPDIEGIAKAEVEEGDIDEYLLKRAEAELRRAQARVDVLKQDIADKAPWRSEV